MNPLEQFFEKMDENPDYKKERNLFRDYYSAVEALVIQQNGRGNLLDWIAENCSVYSKNKSSVEKLIKKGYIKNSNQNFEVNRSIKNMTDYLRAEIFNEDNENTYNGNIDRAVLALVKQVRDNITHYGKMEVDDTQFERNRELIRLTTILIVSVYNQLIENHKRT